MRKGLLGLAAGGMLIAGAATFPLTDSLISFYERNPDLAHYEYAETKLQAIKDRYTRLSQIEQMHRGSDYLRRHDALLDEQNRLRELPAVQEGLKEKARYEHALAIPAYLTVISVVTGLIALFSSKKKKPDE